jgi:5-dehydro-2-deoxygluconokinase
MGEGLAHECNVSLELLTVGRIGVDFYAEQIGVPLDRAETFAKSIGGSPTNVAVAAARLGRRSAVFTKVGDDVLGEYARGALQRLGVDTRFVGAHPTLRTPLVIAAMDPPEDPWFVFYREPKAPDMELRLDDVDLDVVRAVPILWVSASGMAEEPARSTLRELLAERARREHTVLDLDYRPAFWPSEAEARATIGAAVDAATVAVGNRSECEIAVGESDPDAAADSLLRRGVGLAIVKLGGDGVLVATPDERRLLPPVPVSVVSGLGAGDAFGGALCHGLLAGWDPFTVAEFANAAGALVASRLLCADAMPSVQEVEGLLEESRAQR